MTDSLSSRYSRLASALLRLAQAQSNPRDAADLRSAANHVLVASHCSTAGDLVGIKANLTQAFALAAGPVFLGEVAA